MPERNGEGKTLYREPREPLPLLWDGAEAGTVEVVREGLYLRFHVRTAAQDGWEERERASGDGGKAGDGLWRVWLRGEDGETRLGTLEPSDGAPDPSDDSRKLSDRMREPAVEGLSLDRRLSIRSLAPLGPLLCCEVRPVSEDERPGRNSPSDPSHGIPPGPSNLSAAPDIWPRPGGGVLLSYPSDGPFPLPDLFCFARLGTVRGRECWVFAFDGAGHPIFE